MTTIIEPRQIESASVTESGAALVLRAAPVEVGKPVICPSRLTRVAPAAIGE